MSQRYCAYCLELCGSECLSCGALGRSVSEIPLGLGIGGWVCQCLDGASPDLLRAVGSISPCFVLAEGTPNVELINELAPKAPYEALQYHKDKLSPEVKLGCEKRVIEEGVPLWNDSWFSDDEESNGDDEADEEEYNEEERKDNTWTE